MAYYSAGSKLKAVNPISDNVYSPTLTGNANNYKPFSREEIGIRNAFANLSILLRVIFLSARSIIPIYVRWKPDFAANSSWDKPSFFLSSLTRFANLSRIGFFITESLGTC